MKGSVMCYFQTERLTVGYRGNIVIRDIDIKIEKGKILTLIGPNGAGKSTVLRTIAGQLNKIGGVVLLDRRDIQSLGAKRLARELAVVLTERVHPELITCWEVVAMGRYPYTGIRGTLMEADKRSVERALERVGARELADQEFTSLSDGQRQRIMLARALCQEPQILVLDEPTAYLDIFYKLEVLEILQRMAREEGLTVVMSLHEIDLASKISDSLICVKGDTIEAYGSPEEIMESGVIEKLYGLREGSYHRLYGSVELARPEGEIQVFVVAGGGCGTKYYRMLQKQGIPFATGILFDNDIDLPSAVALSEYVVTAPAFESMTEEQYECAARQIKKVRAVIDAGTPVGSRNQLNGRLLKLAEEMGLPVYRGMINDKLVGIFMHGKEAENRK